MPIYSMEIPDVINIKPISGNAHTVCTYCVSQTHVVYDVRRQSSPYLGKCRHMCVLAPRESYWYYNVVGSFGQTARMYSIILYILSFVFMSECVRACVCACICSCVYALSIFRNQSSGGIGGL